MPLLPSGCRQALLHRPSATCFANHCGFVYLLPLSSPCNSRHRRLATKVKGKKATPKQSLAPKQSPTPKPADDGNGGATDGRTLPAVTPLLRNTKSGSPKKVAVIGAGITGLAAAHYIRKFSPSTQVKLFESSDRVGGWIKTDLLQANYITHDEGKEATETIDFNKGPRTLRYSKANPASALATIEFLNDLDLLSQVRHWRGGREKEVGNRYIYSPSTQLPRGAVRRLIKAPNGANEIPDFLLNSPLSKGLLPNVFLEPLRWRRRRSVEDESIYSVISRRVSPHVAENVVSAIYHGVYAGDIKKLSFQALMPNMYRHERKFGSMLGGLFSKKIPEEDKKLKEEIFADEEISRSHRKFIMSGSSIFYFDKGMEVFPLAALERLKGHGKNFSFMSRTPVVRAKYNKTSDSVDLTYLDGKATTTESFDYAVCCTSAKVAARIVTDDVTSVLPEINYVTVMVVNFLFARPGLVPKGFGYLIPSSASDKRHNPYNALGVIFDSWANARREELLNFTKLSVLIGGHYWDHYSESDYPSKERGVHMAAWYLEHHLGIKDAPIAVDAEICRDCIPQLEVGHAGRMRQIHRDLSANMGGKFALAGAAYSSPGVPDCVKHAREVARYVTGGYGVTGLERWAFESKWVDP